jgi:hypothetical protein
LPSLVGKVDSSKPTCGDNYIFPTGWYVISVNDENGNRLVLALKNAVPTGGSQPTQFIDLAYANSNYATSNRLFIIQSVNS